MMGFWPLASEPLASDGAVASGMFTMSISETVTATDSYSPAFDLAMTIAESVSATDSLANVASLSMAISEIVTAVDGILGGAAYTAAITEVVTAGDGVLVVRAAGLAVRWCQPHGRICKPAGQPGVKLHARGRARQPPSGPGTPAIA